jgi:hypothetical protein
MCNDSKEKFLLLDFMIGTSLGKKKVHGSTLPPSIPHIIIKHNAQS